MNKKKGEKAYLVVFPTDKDGGQALDLLCAEGWVCGRLSRGIPATVITERQLRRLDRAGIRRQFVTPAMTKKESQKSRESHERVVNERPFGQWLIQKKKAVLEPCAGPAYTFYLRLPRQRQGRDVFSATDAQRLFRLLITDFGGCCATDERKSLIIGGWPMPQAERIKPASDLYRSYTLYAKPTNESKTYFRRLEANLRTHLLAMKGIEEEQILIERRAVEIIKGGR